MNKNKVILTYYDYEGNLAEERVWVHPVNANLYRVENIPFFAPNLALYDIISVEIDNELMYFDDLLTPSGHATIQIIFLNPEEKDTVLMWLEQQGCSWEGMSKTLYFALDIPPNINYLHVTDYLNIKREKAILDYKEACLPAGANSSQEQKNGIA
jgi:Domain of unknown function (DUF4265)